MIAILSYNSKGEGKISVCKYKSESVKLLYTNLALRGNFK